MPGISSLRVQGLFHFARALPLENLLKSLWEILNGAPGPRTGATETMSMWPSWPVTFTTIIYALQLLGTMTEAISWSRSNWSCFNFVCFFFLLREPRAKNCVLIHRVTVTLNLNTKLPGPNFIKLLSRKYCQAHFFAKLEMIWIPVAAMVTV